MGEREEGKESDRCGERSPDVLLSCSSCLVFSCSGLSCPVLSSPAPLRRVLPRPAPTRHLLPGPARSLPSLVRPSAIVRRSSSVVRRTSSVVRLVCARLRPASPPRGEQPGRPADIPAQDTAPARGPRPRAPREPSAAAATAVVTGTGSFGVAPVGRLQALGTLIPEPNTCTLPRFLARARNLRPPISTHKKQLR